MSKHALVCVALRSILYREQHQLAGWNSIIERL